MCAHVGVGVEQTFASMRLGDIGKVRRCPRCPAHRFRSKDVNVAAPPPAKRWGIVRAYGGPAPASRTAWVHPCGMFVRQIVGPVDCFRDGCDYQGME